MKNLPVSKSQSKPISIKIEGVTENEAKSIFRSILKLSQKENEVSAEFKKFLHELPTKEIDGGYVLELSLCNCCSGGSSEDWWGYVMADVCWYEGDGCIG